MNDLTEFLAARLDEDEAVAKRAAAAPAVQHEGSKPGDWSWLRTFGQPQPDMIALIDHQARFDPARVLREVEAKRAILAEYEPVAKNDGPGEPEYAYGWAEGLGIAVRALAAVYSDHPDYDPEWTTSASSR